MDKYSGLEAMKFGYKELNQLWLTILEIADENNIPSKEAVSKFLKDIKEQYDYKLGFEIKVKKKNELVLLNNQITDYQIKLQMTPFVGPTLFSLFQKGINEQDIININQLVEINFNDDSFNNFNLDVDNINDKKK